MKNLTKIEEIYHTALEIEGSEREEYLSQKCVDDVELRREVESLLSYEEKAESFIESPPEDLAEDFFANHTSKNIIGKTLNNYKILSLIGAGGMGEVYLAEDIKLGRKIAIKLLPTKFSANKERKARFLREARAVSALNHPNILTVYGIEEIDDLDFTVTEFIDGKTVSELLSEKSFDCKEVIEIALQLTDALESAHKIGIIHRDIKPANIMIREDGYVKILDFGLAKMLAEDKESESFNTREHTKKRSVMGTINYMSPEQALGEKLDARTDIFSLGVVLYEMLSGAKPFAGESDAAIYNATINSEPKSLIKLNKDTPPALEKIIKYALVKDRKLRYQSIADMRSDLQSLKENSVSNSSYKSFNNYNFSDTYKTQRYWFTKILAPIVAISAILVSFAVIYFYTNGSTSESKNKLNNLTHKQLTSDGGEELFPSLSPDGKTFVYSSGILGGRNLYFQRVGGMKSIKLTDDENVDDVHPVYSPDGESIAFSSKRKGSVGIYLMGATGESIRRIADRGFHPSWSPDGSEIVYSTLNVVEPADLGRDGEIWAVNILSGAKRLIYKEENSLQPNWSPNGQRIAIWSSDEAGNRDIQTISSSGGDVVSLTDDAFLDWNPVWSADGKYLYYLSDRSGSMNLWRVSINEESGKPLGEPEPVTFPSNRIRYLSFSRGVKKFIYNQTTVSSNIYKIVLDPDSETVSGEAIVITKGSKYKTNPNVSGNSEKLTFGSIGDAKEDIYIANADGSNLQSLTNDEFKDRTPRFSPDGERIAFFSDKTGRYEGWMINSDGSGLRRITETSGDTWSLLPVWSPDGKRVLYNNLSSYPLIYDPDKDFSQQAPMELPTKRKPNKRFFFVYSWSPDGKKLAGLRDKKEQPGDFVWTYNFDTQTFKNLDVQGDTPFWFNDSRRILSFDKDKIYLIDSETNRKKKIFSVAPKTIQAIFLTKDSRSIYYSLNNRESDIWMASVEE